MNHPTACCAAPGSCCARTDRLVGLDGVHVTDVARTGQELVLTIETPARLEGCGVCGVVAVSHGRRNSDEPPSGRNPWPLTHGSGPAKIEHGSRCIVASRSAP